MNEHNGSSADYVDGIRAIRESVGLGRRQIEVWRVRDGWDAVDAAVPTDLHLRDGQLRQALLLNDDGTIAADLTVAADDEDLLLFVQGARPELGIAGAERLDDHVVLGLDGPFAWELLAAWDSPGVVGLPYLSLYRPRPSVICLRAGKTGEYGYDLLVPRTEADAISAELTALGEAFDARWTDASAHRYCALENWFYDHEAVAHLGLTPVELQLQWRLSPTKAYRGRAAIEARRPGERRITGIVGDAPLAGDVTLDGEVVGSVIAAYPAHGRPGWIGMALLDLRYAHSGIADFAVGGSPIRTVSPPFVLNRSLFVRGQRHSYANRAAIRYPDA